MTSIKMQDLDSLAEKLSALDLPDGEAVALDALLSLGTNDDDDDVSGFVQRGMFSGGGLAGSLTGSGLFSASAAGTELMSSDAGTIEFTGNGTTTPDARIRRNAGGSGI